MAWEGLFDPPVQKKHSEDGPPEEMVTYVASESQAPTAEIHEENPEESPLPELKGAHSEQTFSEDESEPAKTSQTTNSDQTIRDPGNNSAIEYQIGGSGIQYLKVGLRPGQRIFSEPGALRCYPPCIKMETNLIGNDDKKGLGKLISPLKRAISGESLFLVNFLNTTDRDQSLTFAAPYPGEILALHLTEGRSIHCQAGAFLCGTGNLDISPGFAGVNASVFSGEGVVLQKCRGEGIVFLHAGGALVKEAIPAGGEVRVETGSLVAWDSNLGFDVTLNTGIRNIFFSSEGLWFTTLENRTHHECHAYVQSMPFKRLVDIIDEKLPKPKKL